MDGVKGTKGNAQGEGEEMEQSQQKQILFENARMKPNTVCANLKV